MGYTGKSNHILLQVHRKCIKVRPNHITLYLLHVLVLSIQILHQFPATCTCRANFEILQGEPNICQQNLKNGFLYNFYLCCKFIVVQSKYVTDMCAQSVLSTTQFCLWTTLICLGKYNILCSVNNNKIYTLATST